MLCRTPVFHAFGFRWRDSAPKNSATGLAVRFRVPGGWRHFAVHTKPAFPRKGRGCWTVEAETWRTLPDSNTRTTVKAFVRVRVGLGGRA